MGREDEIEDEREDEIEAIVEVGRRTRTPTPRWLWIAAGAIAVICATGLTAVMLGQTEPPEPRVEHSTASRGGFGAGLAIGAGAGLVIGVALARQRRDHSSRRRP